MANKNNVLGKVEYTGEIQKDEKSWVVTLKATGQSKRIPYSVIMSDTPAISTLHVEV